VAALAFPAHAAFEHVLDVELTADLSDASSGTAILFDRRARDHAQASRLQRAQLRDQLVRDADPQVRLGRVVAQVLERQHRHHEPTGRWGSRRVTRARDQPCSGRDKHRQGRHRPKRSPAEITPNGR
jgi:predicted outer membrane protein